MSLPIGRIYAVLKCSDVRLLSFLGLQFYLQVLQLGPV